MGNCLGTSCPADAAQPEAVSRSQVHLKSKRNTGRNLQASPAPRLGGHNVKIAAVEDQLSIDAATQAGTGTGRMTACCNTTRVPTTQSTPPRLHVESNRDEDDARRDSLAEACMLASRHYEGGSLRGSEVEAEPGSGSGRQRCRCTQAVVTGGRSACRHSHCHRHGPCPCPCPCEGDGDAHHDGAAVAGRASGSGSGSADGHPEAEKDDDDDDGGRGAMMSASTTGSIHSIVCGTSTSSSGGGRTRSATTSSSSSSSSGIMMSRCSTSSAGGSSYSSSSRAPSTASCRTMRDAEPSSSSSSSTCTSSSSSSSAAIAPTLSRNTGSLRSSRGGSSMMMGEHIVGRLSYAEVAAMCDGFSPSCAVGEGGAAVVYHGREKGCGSLAGMGDVAIKLMCTQALKARGWDEWLVSE